MPAFRPLMPLAAPLLIVLASGCEAGRSGSSPETGAAAAGPSKGSTITVHFRRDALGLSADHPVPVDSDNHSGADLTVSGSFERMDDDWLVLAGTNGREEWVPRDAILHLSVSAP